MIRKVRAEIQVAVHRVMKRKSEDNRVCGGTLYLRTANHDCVSNSNFNHEPVLTARPRDQLFYVVMFLVS